MQDKFKDDLMWIYWDKKYIKTLFKTVNDILKNQEKFFLNLKDNKEDINFKNLIYKFQIDDFIITKIMTGLWSIHNVSVNKELRDEARETKVKISSLLTEFSYNENIYSKFKIYFDKYFDIEKKILNQEEILIIEDLENDYKKRGMNLIKSKRNVLIKKINKINDLASKFDENCNKRYTKGFWFKKEELEGVPLEIINNYNFEPKTNKYFVSVVPSVMQPVAKFCHNENTRKKIIEISQEGVGEANNKLFREILKLREDIRKILNYKTFSEMAMDKQLVSKPVEAINFCKSLIKNLKTKLENEKKVLKKYLKKGEKLTYYNVSYLENLAISNELKVDQNEIKKYFELENTLNNMFSLWKKYFKVEMKFDRKVIEIHKDVYKYNAYDVTTGEHLGNAIFDLFPRNGKYGHACVEQVQPRIKDESGKVFTPTAMMLCNFQKSKNDKTLLSINDVSTLFHEGGHMLHVLLGKNNFYSTSPFNTVIDFVEIPSQFMENFIIDAKTSKEVAKHIDTGKSLSKDLIKKIKKIDEFIPAWANIGSLSYSLFDLEIHGKDILKFSNKKGLLKDRLNQIIENNLNIITYKKKDFPSMFSHLVHGYESKYYSYLVSKVYAQDAWFQFVNKYKYNGKAYRKLLENAKLINEAENLENFLGRKPKDESFIKDIIS